MGIDMTYLSHDGVKNMKWGLRRYRNYDGSLTEEGKRRYYKNYSGKEDEVDQAFKKENANRQKEISENKKNVASLTNNITSIMPSSRVYVDVSNKSDAVLREETNRMRLENAVKDYKINQMKSSRASLNNVSNGLAGVSLGAGVAGGILSLTGKLKGNEKLHNIGDVLTVGSALGMFGSGALKTISGMNAFDPKKKYSIDLSNYTTEDLQKIVNRINLEQNYTIEQSKYSRYGKMNAKDVINDIGTAATLSLDAMDNYNKQVAFVNGWDINKKK